MVRCGWYRRNGLLQVFVVLSSVVITGNTSSNNSSSSSNDNVYRLIPPSVYVVFGGDLEVLFHMPGNVSLPNAFVKLQGQRPRDNVWIEVTTMGLPLSHKTGTLTVACGIVEFAGRYSLTMVMQVDGPILTQVTFTSVWPSLSLRLPDTHSALTSPVTMEIESRARCSSRLQREFVTLELYFQRFEDSESLVINFSNVERVTAVNFTTLDSPESRWQYPCKFFDQDGYYQAALRSSSGTTLTMSNVMTSTFSASYHLASEHASVFPCDSGSSLSVRYTHPSCAKVDRFRVYRLSRKASGSTAAPVERVYVGEFEASPDRSRFELGCEVFREEDDKAVGYCWVYVTMARSGVVVEQKELCLPAWPGAVLPQDGGWSSWTAWTMCSVTCGSGKRSRFRICNSPLPEYGGRHCSGHPVQWSYCLTPCPDLLPRSPLRAPHFDPNCLCGCTHTSKSGEIIGTGRCVGLATWIIKTTPEERIVLTFRYYSISYEKQWVKVRDGGTESDELLYYSHHQPQPPADLTSSSNVMRVELMTTMDMSSPVNVKVFPRNATVPIHVQGFIASYSVTVPGSSERPPPLYRHEEASLMDSEVTIVGLAVVGAVVLAVVIFAVAQRKFWSKKVPRYSAAKMEEASGPLGQSGSGQFNSRIAVSGVDVSFPGERGRPGKSSSDPRLASRNSSATSTEIMQGRARAHTTATAADRRGQSAQGFSPHFSKDTTNRVPIRSVSVGESLHDDLKMESSYAGVRMLLPKPEPTSAGVRMLLPKPDNRFGGELQPCAAYASVHSPPPTSPTKQELLKRKRRKKKGVSTHSSGGRGDREVKSSSRQSSSTNTDIPSGRVTTTKAEINFTKPGGYLRSPSDSTISMSAGNVKSPLDFKERRVRRDRGRRRSDGDRNFQKEHIPLVHSQGEPHTRQSHNSHRPTSLHKETAFVTPTTNIKRPVSLTENVASLNTTGIETVVDIETHADAQPKRTKSKTQFSSDSAGKYSAVEEETLLPTTQDRISNCVDKEPDKAEKKERDSKSSSPSKCSSLVPTSDKVLAPSRSSATPELEYDDFILEDPKSHFQYEDLSRLNWPGSEKLGRTRHKEYS